MADLKIKINTTYANTGICVMATLGNGITAAASIGTNTPVLLSTLSDNSFTVPVGFSGRIYMFLTSDVKNVPTNPAALNTDLDIRYDWVEATYDGTSTAACNLTSVDQLGIAMSLETQDSAGAKMSSVGYNATLTDIVTAMTAAAPKAVIGKLSDSTFKRVKSPLHTAAGVWPDMTKYLTDLNGSTINILGPYDGSTDANGNYHGPANFSYTCTFDYSKTTTDITLKSNTGSGISGDIIIAKTDLMDMIYACDGAFNVPGTTAGPSGNGTADKVGFNDPWSTVVRNFLVGFNLGFYGYKPTPVNGYKYDCNNSWDWDSAFAFKKTFNETTFNTYAEIIFDNSNSYGFPFSDFLGKPLVDLYEVSTLQITMLKDTETNSDYLKPTPASLSPVGTTDPQTGDGTTSIILNGGVGTPQPYGGKVVFNGNTFQFGENAQWATPDKTTAGVAGNCSIYNVPANKSSIVHYQFSFTLKPFNLYLQFDSNGLITDYAIDGGLVCTLAADSLSVTISNILNHIAPPVIA